ncbi:hypothetical protein [Acidipropionibacterium jensenii]|uniref:hypothetical protein n=1 Tax=Acidipropionibacterium jensenii TaxID=1749 RepID=UPI0026481848|nr:hypothetical protein [Acidipropionibacterium jensenii]MDN5997319.1 hypothetical protein [Acidipropionibacterium jensenii]MDN6655816.1 hypothetical protein [Bifidobacterium crudilactis]
MSGDNWHHSNKEWQETLDLAKAYGWPEPREAKDHGGLVLSCPAADRSHQIRVFSTGKGTENAARSSRNKIKKCQHSRGAKSIRAAISSHLKSAARWIRAAELATTAGETEQRLERLVEDADDSMADADRQFDLLEAEIEMLDSELKDLIPTEPRPTVLEMADLAHSDLRNANGKLRNVPSGADQVGVLRTRYQELLARLDVIHRQLAR